jgi:hypothetical protein
MNWLVEGLGTIGNIYIMFRLIMAYLAIIVSVLVLFYVNTRFEADFVTQIATVKEKPVCKTENNITNGELEIEFIYNNQNYNLKIPVHDDCYVYDKGSSIEVRFSPNDIPGSIYIKGRGVKTLINTLMIFIIIVALIIIIINRTFRNNKVYRTFEGVQGLSNLI